MFLLVPRIDRAHMKRMTPIDTKMVSVEVELTAGTKRPKAHRTQPEIFTFYFLHITWKN